MRSSRMPQIADMIIETCPDTGSRYVGLVREINLDDWGHQKNVFIAWAEKSPRHYNEEHGYSGVNIHNVRDRYKVIRNGRVIR